MYKVEDWGSTFIVDEVGLYITTEAHPPQAFAAMTECQSSATISNASIIQPKRNGRLLFLTLIMDFTNTMSKRLVERGPNINLVFATA